MRKQSTTLNIEKNEWIIDSLHKDNLKKLKFIKNQFVNLHIVNNAEILFYFT